MENLKGEDKDGDTEKVKTMNKEAHWYLSPPRMVIRGNYEERQAAMFAIAVFLLRLTDKINSVILNNNE